MKPMNFRERWVLVTGASSGLGHAMARKLAYEHGAHIVAVARREQRLRELKEELESKANVQVVTVCADLADVAEVDRALEQATQGRQLYAAILNAGVTHFGEHGRLSWLDFQRMLNTNVTSVVRMATELVPHLDKPGLGGGLMLVASMAGITPIPYQTAYSGTKAFLVHFGCGLWHELQHKQISITTYAPGGIVTEMTGTESFRPLRGWLMPVDRAAVEGIEAFRKRRYLHVPGYSNRLGSVLMRFLPQRIVTSQIAASYRRALKLTGQI
ncbi:MAG TPA: SDR family NAD(P)-dependent oxidoreductase [Polyangiaceae bacterium]